MTLGSASRKRQDEPGGGLAAGNDKEPQVEALLGVARRLDYMIGQVTPDEFAWQDANYDRDSALGRELLFLIANDGWIRSTSEIIDIARSDAIETAIDIDIDLSRITHEAFRDWSGQMWLPVVVLPPLRQQLPDPEPFSTLAVTDASGTQLMTLPRADVRHRLAAALTEIILNVVAARLPDVSDQAFSASRDHRLVLSAAIYRLLRDETVPALLLNSNAPMRQELREPLGRLDRARQEVGTVLKIFADLLAGLTPGQLASKAAARELTERAILVLSAFTRSAVVVIPASREQPPTQLTVRLPGRALHLAAATWPDVFGPDATSHRRWTRSRAWRRHLRLSNWIFPNASLHLDLLLSSASADRQVRVNLPEGISPDPSLLLIRRAELDVRCEPPVPMRQLSTVTDQLMRADPDWPAPLHQSLADLALAKVNAVAATLRDHSVGAGPAEEALSPSRTTKETRAFRASLRCLGLALRQIAARGHSGDAYEALALAWAGGSWLDAPMQRRTSTDTISPGVVAARARAIDDVPHRSAAASARMEVRIAVTDSTYYSTARLSGWINSVLMLVELVFFPIAHRMGLAEQQVSAEVLAFVLTLFSAIQLGRIERPDRSSVRGVLVPSGNPLIVAAILPSVVLAVAIAFSRSLTWVVTWAGVCLALQLSWQWLTWYLQIRALHRGNADIRSQPQVLAGDDKPESDLLFYTDAPNYGYDTVIHGSWWCRTTAEALMIDHAAFGYLIWQHDNGQPLSTLLDIARPASKQTARQAAQWLYRHSRLDQYHETASNGETGESPDSRAKSPLEQPANVLALQRSGTGAQSLNFVVFRDQPEAQLRTALEFTVPIDLDPSLLTLAEDATSAISVFAGLPGEAEVNAAGHPITAVTQLATAHGLIVYEIQLPIPAPDVSYAHLEWGRVQLNVTPDGLDHIQVFLASLMSLTATAVVGIQSRADGIPRLLNPLPLRAASAEPGQAAKNGLPVRAADLDVVARSRTRHREDAARTWRLMAVCADWQPGIESRMLAGLGPDLMLVGMTAVVLYGQSVLLLLCHGSQARADLGDPRLRRAVVFDQWQSRNELGSAPPQPLLRVHLRTQDRPGATVAVLDALHKAMQHEFPRAFSGGDWNVWYARAVVRDGNTAHVQLTIMLPVSHDTDLEPIYAWEPSDFSRIERRALALLTIRMAESRHYSEPRSALSEMPSNTIIRIGLVRAPDLSLEQSESDQDPSLETGAELPPDAASLASPGRSLTGRSLTGRERPDSARRQRRLFRADR